MFVVDDDGESEKLELPAKADPAEPREIKLAAKEISGCDGVSIEIGAAAVANADALAVIDGAGCREPVEAVIAVPTSLVAIALNGFPLASLAAIVTVAGLPAAPPITRAL